MSIINVDNIIVQLPLRPQRVLGLPIPKKKFNQNNFPSKDCYYGRLTNTKYNLETDYHRYWLTHVLSLV